jgi:hypothetical protein
MFSLVPRQGTGKPRFEARIDDGTPAKRKEPELDIDIKGVPSGVESAFKGNRNGYIDTTRKGARRRIAEYLP